MNPIGATTMLRDLLRSFTATHLTILGVVAMLAPGAVVAAVAYQPVAIVNPSTGAQAYVSPGKLLFVYDQIAGYTNAPANIVNISAQVPNDVGDRVIYTVPAGKALIIKSIQASYNNNAAGILTYTYIYDDSYKLLTTFEGAAAADSKTMDTSGIVVRSGALRLVSGGRAGSQSKVYVQGYLVPASVVPAASASADGPAQIVSSGAPFNPNKPQ